MDIYFVFTSEELGYPIKKNSVASQMRATEYYFLYVKQKTTLLQLSCH